MASADGSPALRVLALRACKRFSSGALREEVTAHAQGLHDFRDGALPGSCRAPCCSRTCTRPRHASGPAVAVLERRPCRSPGHPARSQERHEEPAAETLRPRWHAPLPCAEEVCAVQCACEQAARSRHHRVWRLAEDELERCEVHERFARECYAKQLEDVGGGDDTVVVVQDGKDERVWSGRQAGEADPMQEEERADFERGADDARDDCEGLCGESDLTWLEGDRRLRLTTNFAVPKRRSRVIEVL